MWNSVPNGAYRLECSEDLAVGHWKALEDVVVATGLTVEALCAADGSGQSFFRVRVEP
jgi:hypothetical protein